MDLLKSFNKEESTEPSNSNSSILIPDFDKENIEVVS